MRDAGCDPMESALQLDNEACEAKAGKAPGFHPSPFHPPPLHPPLHPPPPTPSPPTPSSGQITCLRFRLRPPLPPNALAHAFSVDVKLTRHKVAVRGCAICYSGALISSLALIT